MYSLVSNTLMRWFFFFCTRPIRCRNVIPLWLISLTPEPGGRCFHSLMLCAYRKAANTKPSVWPLNPQSDILELRTLTITTKQTWGQLLSNVIDYITITLKFSWLHYIMITSIFKCNRLNCNYFVNVINYITDYI